MAHHPTSSTSFQSGTQIALQVHTSQFQSPVPASWLVLTSTCSSRISFHDRIPFHNSSASSYIGHISPVIQYNLALQLFTPLFQGPIVVPALCLSPAAVLRYHPTDPQSHPIVLQPHHTVPGSHFTAPQQSALRYSSSSAASPHSTILH